MEVKNDGVENACLSEDNLHDPIAVYLACTSSGILSLLQHTWLTACDLKKSLLDMKLKIIGNFCWLIYVWVIYAIFMWYGILKGFI